MNLAKPEIVRIFDDDISNEQLEDECTDLLVSGSLYVYDIIRKDGKIIIYFANQLN